MSAELPVAGQAQSRLHGGRPVPAVVAVPGWWNDLLAGVRHLRVRAMATASDPVTLCLLAFAGLVTIGVWPSGLGIDLWTAARVPFRGGQLSGPVRDVSRLWRVDLFAPSLTLHVLWCALVGAACAGRLAIWSSRGASARPLPALPVGARTRVVAETMVGLAIVAVVRMTLLLLAGDELRSAMLRLAPRNLPGPSFLTALLVTTLLGTLLALPLVLAWTAELRFDARALVKPAIVSVLLYAAASVGAMAHAWPALAVSLGLAAFVLVRLEEGDRTGTLRAATPLRFRSSPGALRQLTRDARQGPLRQLWLYVLLVGVLPLLPLAAHGLMAGWARTSMTSWRGPHIAFLQWFALLVPAFLPLGLQLASPGGSGRSVFGGSFLKAWSVLPLVRESVVRVVYVHAFVASVLAWLVLLAHSRLAGAGFGLAAFELPAVLLIPAIVVCEAVGDRRRGLLAAGCLAGFQFGLLGGTFVLSLAMPMLVDFRPPFGVELVIAANVLGLIGGLPPLVHLRTSRPHDVGLAQRPFGLES